MERTTTAGRSATIIGRETTMAGIEAEAEVTVEPVSDEGRIASTTVGAIRTDRRRPRGSQSLKSLPSNRLSRKTDGGLESASPLCDKSLEEAAR